MTLKSEQVHHVIRKVFRVKGNNLPPYTGWKKPNDREDLYDAMNQMGCFTCGAEIGVRIARNALEMFKRIKDLNLICVDPWTPYNRRTPERMEKWYRRTCRRLKPYGDRATIIRKTSMDALADVKEGSLDFVYIDGFHEFDYVMPDIIFWAKKVRLNGIVAGHDYYPFYRGGVMQAVDAYTRAHGINNWYVTMGDEPTWFWVKDYTDAYS